MTGAELNDFAARCAAVLDAAALTVGKRTSKKTVLALLVDGGMSATDLEKVAAMPEFSSEYYNKIERAEQLGTPLLRDTAAGNTPANQLRSGDTFNLFFALLRFKLVAGPAKPGPKPSVEPWFGRLAEWMDTYAAFFKASGFAEQARLTKPQVSDLLSGRNTTAATAERKLALHSTIQKVLKEALDTLPAPDEP